jgi:cyclophilin family peptidyl-prolyl cis-trans isomerase/HEAT repeat protein
VTSLPEVKLRHLLSCLAACFSLAFARPAAAQESAVVEALAPVLQAEDSRTYVEPLFQRASTSPDSQVRRFAARSIGRIGDPRGLDVLRQLLVDPDTLVRLEAAFAVGLIGDTAGIRILMERFQNEPYLDAASALEAITSLARVGGPVVGEFFRAALEGRFPPGVRDPVALRNRVAFESWRLGDDAPITSLLPLAADQESNMRWHAVYSLARLRAPEAAGQLSLALRDEMPIIRSAAVRGLVPEVVDRVDLGREGAASLVVVLLDDRDPITRINALRTLADLEARQFSDRVIDRLRDAIPNVRVQAAATLGMLGGPEAVAALKAQAEDRSLPAAAAEALLGLARLDSAAFAAVGEPWKTSTDWTRRMVYARGTARAGRPGELLDDSDGRVVAASLDAWASLPGRPGPGLLAAARRRLDHEDPVVRTIAAGVLARQPNVADVPALANAFGRSLRDPVADASLAALDALRAVSAASAEGRRDVQSRFMASAPRPSSPVVRSWAAGNWPALAARWGSNEGVETGRTLQDYREIIRRFVLAPDSIARPHVFVETDGPGTLEIELLGPEAPLTVAHFLALVDRRYFDGMRWHRVAPGFVAQTGDPRGDGWGGPGVTIRDEINRRRFDNPMVGMALSGPDTGGSQWFINVSPQPHLDGRFTVFGRVAGSYAPLARLTEGDIIRTVRR